MSRPALDAIVSQANPISPSISGAEIDQSGLKAKNTRAALQVIRMTGSADYRVDMEASITDSNGLNHTWKEISNWQQTDGPIVSIFDFTIGVKFRFKWISGTSMYRCLITG